MLRKECFLKRERKASFFFSSHILSRREQERFQGLISKYKLGGVNSSLSGKMTFKNIDKSRETSEAPSLSLPFFFLVFLCVFVLLLSRVLFLRQSDP